MAGAGTPFLGLHNVRWSISFCDEGDPGIRANQVSRGALNLGVAATVSTLSWPLALSSGAHIELLAARV
jgi:hypothetical protein